MLNVKELNKLKEGIFASGTVSDNPVGINMTNSDKLLRWVAVKGYAHDWTIYCHWADKSKDWIKQSGDKVCSEENIKKLVPCDDEAFSKYHL